MKKIMKINFKKLISSLGIGLLGGLLGAYGGADGTSKAWRRIGLTLLYTLYGLLRLRSWWGLIMVSVFYPLTCGYGIPDSTDKGSTIGRFWYNLFKENHLFADIFTRGTIALMILASIIVAPILTRNWVNYFLYGLGVIVVFCFISWRNYGKFKFLNKDLSWAEILTWGVTTFCVIKIIG